MPIKSEEEYQQQLQNLQNRLRINVRKIRNNSRLRPIQKQMLIQRLTQQCNGCLRRLRRQRQRLPRTIPDKFAVLVGINYNRTPYQLYGCINDVNNVKSLLSENFGYKNITILTDKTKQRPNRKNILGELTKMLKNSITGDKLFFMFSGHGTYTPDKNGDELDGYDEMIVPVNMKIIKDDELYKIIVNNLKPGVQLFALFDSCFSGSVLDLKYNYLDSENANQTTINPYTTESPQGQVIMISGCSDSQTSADAVISNGTTQQNSGAMTFAFTTTIRDNLTTSTSITYQTLIESMRTLLLESQFDQIPQLSSVEEINIATENVEF